jgi:DinB family protein
MMPLTLDSWIAGDVRAAFAMVLANLDGLPAADAVRIPPGARNHLLWHAGHVTLTSNALFLASTGNPRPLPDAWRSAFGRGSEAVSDAAGYPAIEEIRARLEADVAAAIDVVRRIDASGWERTPEPPVDRFFPTVERAVRHGLLHAAYHAGEMSVLRRLLGLSPSSETYFERASARRTITG